MKTQENNDYEERSVLYKYFSTDHIKREMKIARIVAVIYTATLAVNLLLSLLIHSTIVSYILSLMLSSWLAIILAVILLTIAIDKTAKFPLKNKGYQEETAKAQQAYRRNTIRLCVFFITSLILLIALRKYADIYKFNCTTVYVEEPAKVIHFMKDCPRNADKANTIQMLGAETDLKNYTICPLCPPYEFRNED